MRRNAILALAAALGIGGTLGAAALIGARIPAAGTVSARPVWSEAPWPFPPDPWGRGKAFRCLAEHCGAEVNLYVRAKIGLCGCVTAIDDDDVDRVSDLDVIGGERMALGPGRAIEVRWMKGRSRAYSLGGRGATALAIAFHDRCDMIVATAAISKKPSVVQEGAVLEFLNSDKILRWAETAIGL